MDKTPPPAPLTGAGVPIVSLSGPGGFTANPPTPSAIARYPLTGKTPAGIRIPARDGGWLPRGRSLPVQSKKEMLQPGAFPRENETCDANVSQDFPGLCGGRSKPDPVEKSNGTGPSDIMQSYSGT